MKARLRVLVFVTLGVFAVMAAVQAAVTERVSVPSRIVYEEADGASCLPSVSADGRYVTFASSASNLTPSDGLICENFVRDRTAQTTTRVCVNSAGTAGDGYSGWPERSPVSADGRCVAFSSDAQNLVNGDTNRNRDVFVRDAQGKVTERVSVTSSGAQGNGYARMPAISGDGNCVAFESDATNLVTGDTNGKWDVFVRDRPAATTSRVSISGSGAQANGDSTHAALSGDGRYVVFESTASNLVSGDTNGAADVFLYDRQSRAVERISVSSSGAQGTGDSDYPAINADGRYVVFESDAASLVAGDTNGKRDIFLRDRQTGTTERISLGPSGQSNGQSGTASISADGRRVAFASDGTNLVAGDTNNATDVFVRDRQALTTERVSVSSYGWQANDANYQPAISADGNWVVFTSAASNLSGGDTLDVTDTFVRDLQARTTERVSVSRPYVDSEANHISDCPTINADGRYLAFESIATNMVTGDTNGKQDVFLRDRLLKLTERVSIGSNWEQANGESWWPALNGDGRYVAFSSSASTLVPGDYNGRWDIFVRDRLLGTTERGSVDGSGYEGNGDSAGPGISRDGRYVAFASDASNFVSGDTNNLRDMFVHDRVLGTTTLISKGPLGEAADGISEWPVFSADGRYLAFQSEATNLVPGDTNGVRDVFVYDLLLGAMEGASVNGAGEQGNGDCWWFPALSADGRYVAYESDASNLVAGDTNGKRDVFVRDRVTGVTERVSLNDAGEQGDGDSWGRVGMSDDARYVTFDSHATNFAPGDTNGKPDVFVRDRELGVTVRVSVSSADDQGISASDYPAMSANGRCVAFESEAANLIPMDLNGWWDVFVRDFLARFLDVPSFFWAYAQIEACAKAGIVGGYPDGTYRPAEEVTRAQMAVFLARAMAGGEANVPDPGCSTPPFPDVACDYWARKHIQYVRDHGVASGYPDGYHPGEVVTRGQMAVFMARAMAGGEANVPDPGCTAPVFPDVDCAFWARKYVQYIKDAGVTGGYPDGTYRPDNHVTRDQMAVYLTRGFGLPAASGPEISVESWIPAEPPAPAPSASGRPSPRNCCHH